MPILNTKPRQWLVALILALPGSLVWASTSDPAQVLQEHLGTARAVLAGSTSNLSSERRERLERALVRAETALASGEWLESLRPYVQVANALSQELVVFRTDPVESLDDLAEESRLLRSELDELGSPLTGKAQRPAALQAQLEAAYSAARAYLTSAGEQGRESGLRAGIYYLKVARGQAELASLLAGLSSAAPEHPVADVPGLSPYLDRLEAELLELYQPPLTQDHHATFIQLSAGLKFAREMRDQSHGLGALEQGLDVARELALFAGTEPQPGTDAAALTQELARWRKVLGSQTTDVTLPALWLEEARQELEGEGPDLASIAVLFDRVLVDYFACLQEVEGEPKPVEPTVTVTLVRWPFT